MPRSLADIVTAVCGPFWTTVFDVSAEDIAAFQVLSGGRVRGLPERQKQLLDSIHFAASPEFTRLQAGTDKVRARPLLPRSRKGPFEDLPVEIWSGGYLFERAEDQLHVGGNDGSWRTFTEAEAVSLAVTEQIITDVKPRRRTQPGGRPIKGRDDIRADYESRRANGECKATDVAEAEELISRYKQRCPGGQPPMPRSLVNRIGEWKKQPISHTKPSHKS
jgi:hypothetical protein